MISACCSSAQVIETRAHFHNSPKELTFHSLGSPSADLLVPKQVEFH